MRWRGHRGRAALGHRVVTRIAPTVGDGPHMEHTRETHMSIFKRYGYVWVTLGLFLFSLLGHWLFGWFAYVNEAREHGQPPEASAYVVEMGRDTLENWQSEFLQLVWQVAGLAYLLYVGSPQSKDSDERVEEKLDFLLSQTEEGKAAKRRIDARHART